MGIKATDEPATSEQITITKPEHTKDGGISEGSTSVPGVVDSQTDSPAQAYTIPTQQVRLLMTSN